MTIRDLAQAVQMTPKAIGNIESGRSTASLPTLRKLARVLKVPVAFLGCFETLPENTLGQRITKARLYHGLTKEEFAQLIGVNEKTLRQWEQGKHAPSPQFADVLNDYLKILED